MKPSIFSRAPRLAIGLATLAITLGGAALSPTARAGVLDEIGGAISDLRGQKSRTISAAQSARAKARAQSERVDFLRQRLLKTSRALDRASSNYAWSYRQMRRTERKIADTETRIEAANQRFSDHKTQFGLRLASMQRHGQTNYLQVALGSLSLSDLSRRTAYFQALTQRDALLQEKLKAGKAELVASQNALMAQWNLRRAAQKQAGRERNRIAQGEAQQLRDWKGMSRARMALLSYAVQQERALGQIDSRIGGLRGRESEIIADNQARQARAARQISLQRAYETERRARSQRIAARERAVEQYRAQMSREREELRAQSSFRARVRRRVVRDYRRESEPRFAAAPRRESRARNRYASNSRYTSNSRTSYRSRFNYRNSRSRYRTTRYRSARRESPRRYARVERISPQSLPAFAPRVGLMPRYAPRIELAPMPIEALQNPARFSLPQ